jgi:hypothetical protein
VNKSQRVILGVGLIVLAVVLHFALCKWTDSPPGETIPPYGRWVTSDLLVFGYLYVRAGISMLAGVFLGIITPIALLTTAAVTLTCSGGENREADSRKNR